MNDVENIFSEYTYSMVQIANEADVGETTVRKYINKSYSDVFPSHKPEGARHDLYPPVAVDIVKRIYELSTNENKSVYEITPIIEEEFKIQLAKYRSVIDADSIESAEDPHARTHARRTPIPAPHPHGSMIEAYNAELVERALFSLDNYRRLLLMKDDELKRTVEALTELTGELETQVNEIADLNREKEELQQENEQLRADIEKIEEQLAEERKKYGPLGIWKKND